MRLYAAAGACSMASHLALIEVGLDFEIESIDLCGDTTTAHGCRYRDINPKGFVPALEMKPGVVLTENIAILQFIADQVPESKLAPAPESFERYRLQEWLGFINSDLHRSFTPLFRASTPRRTRAIHRAKITTYLDYLETVLKGQCYLLGDDFTVADCYLFTVLSWTESVQIDLSAWSAVAAYYSTIQRRESVRAALECEYHVR